MNEYPKWYQSTRGPEISQTITNIAGNLIPVINLVLASQGVNLLPQDVNMYVSLAVFAFFSLRAAVGYIKAKRALLVRIGSLEGEIKRLGGAAK